MLMVIGSGLGALSLIGQSLHTQSLDQDQPLFCAQHQPIRWLPYWHIVCTQSHFCWSDSNILVCTGKAQYIGMYKWVVGWETLRQDD